jgi:hypothetical protein
MPLRAVTAGWGANGKIGFDMPPMTVASVANTVGKLLILLGGDPGRIRTCDLQLRRLLLYPLSYGAARRQGYMIPRQNAW